MLKKKTDLIYLSACFIIAKKDGSVRFITDFRKFNSMILRTPFTLTNIQETLVKLGNFTWATVIDLIMGYYHMVLSEKAKKHYGFVLPIYHLCR